MENWVINVLSMPWCVFGRWFCQLHKGVVMEVISVVYGQYKHFEYFFLSHPKSLWLHVAGLRCPFVKVGWGFELGSLL